MQRNLTPQRTVVLAALMIFTLVSASTQAQIASKFVAFGPDNPLVERPREQRFVSPISSPYFHEDSFVTTDLRAWAIQNKLPSDGALGNGDAQVYAAQIRLALTDQIQFMAYKDGYTNINSAPVSASGWNDLAAGVKWNFLQDAENNLYAAVGVGYQFAVGDEKVLQNSQELRLWGSINKGFGPLHLGLTVNGLIGTGGQGTFGNSDYIVWNAHVDYYLFEWFSPVLEFNGYHTVSQGSVAPLVVSGIDVANLGGGSSEDVITAAIGGELRPMEQLGLRVAYERPLTDSNDIIRDRWTFSAVVGF